MLDDLDATLRTVLGSADAPPAVRGADVSFETPDREYTPGQPTINLYLFGLEENLQLRQAAPEILPTAAGGFERRLPPIRLDCRYLVTAWAAAGTGPGARVALEHQLLGQTAAWLARRPRLSGDLVRGTLTGEELPVRVAPHEDPRILRDLWSSLGGVPRPGFSLVVTLTMSVSDPVPEGGRIAAAEFDLGGGTSWTLAGLVREGTDGDPLAGVHVSLDPGGRQAVTDAGGRYRFTAVPAGSYRLESGTSAHALAARTVVVPPTATDDYDVALTRAP